MEMLHVASLTTEAVSGINLNLYWLIEILNSISEYWIPAVPDPPTTLNVGESIAQRKRRTLVAPDMNLSLDQSEGSVLSDDFLETPDDLDINVDDIETPDETDSLEFINNGNELEWEGQTEENDVKWSESRTKELIIGRLRDKGKG